MQVQMTVVMELGEKPKLHVIPGSLSRVQALAKTGAPEGSQVWIELYETSDPAGEAKRLTKRAKELRKYLAEQGKDIPIIAP